MKKKRDVKNQNDLYNKLKQELVELCHYFFKVHLEIN
jgi:hypothetical protein